MSLRIVIESAAKLDLAEELREEFVEEAKTAVEDAADLLLEDVKHRLRLRIGTERSYAPAGEPPEFETGQLMLSFKRLPARINKFVASSGIRSHDEKVNRLEFGKTDIRGVRTLPHPFVRPAMAAMEQPITDLLRERLT